MGKSFGRSRLLGHVQLLVVGRVLEGEILQGAGTDLLVGSGEESSLAWGDVPLG